MSLEPARKEEWRTVVGWSAYEVSSLGRVRRVKAGKGTQATVMRLQIGKRGYPVVGLTMMPRRKKVVVHRLVCEAFHGSPPPGREVVAHYDGCRTNNRADNLRWATHKENSLDAVRHGTAGSPTKYTDAQIEEVREARKRGLSYSQLSAAYGMPVTTVAAIVTEKIRKRTKRKVRDVA